MEKDELEEKEEWQLSFFLSFFLSLFISFLSYFLFSDDAAKISRRRDSFTEKPNNSSEKNVLSVVVGGRWDSNREPRSKNCLSRFLNRLRCDANDVSFDATPSYRVCHSLSCSDGIANLAEDSMPAIEGD